MIELEKKAFLLSVMRNGEMSLGARLLYWELTQWIDDVFSVCCPTQRALAENLGCSRASIVRWLKELKEQRLVYEIPLSTGKAYEVMTICYPED